MIVLPQRYFPWRIAARIFLSQFFFVALLLIGVLVFLGSQLSVLWTPVVEQLHLDPAQWADLIRQSKWAFIWCLLWSLSLAALYFVVISRGYARPLGALIQRARELRKLDRATPQEYLEPEESADRPGEWADLERALVRIHFDLRMKSQAQAREKDELSTLLEAVSDAILAVDRNGSPLFFNAQFAGFFPVATVSAAAARGSNPAAPATGPTAAPPGAAGRTAARIAKPLTLNEMFRVPDVLQGFSSVLRSGERRLVSASLHTSQHSMPRHFSLSIAPLRLREGGDVYGAVAVFHDVTDLKQSEQIRIEFVGNASHELRTPLTSIKGYVETLKNDFKVGRFDDADSFISIISRNVDRLIFLVNDLLDLSVIESGAELTKSVLSTREVTEAAFKQLEGRRQAKSQELHAHFNAETCLGDPERVEQVVLNLVQNAIKYIPEGRRIDVTWEKSPGSVSLHVKDNGQGIALEHQARLFERFYRVDTGRSREQGGTGLGLAIVKHIMLKHGGHIRLRSAAGQGSEFICTFPE